MSFAAVWENEHREQERRAADAVRAHELSPAHTRPGGLVVVVWDWTSGDASASLVANTTDPAGFPYLPMPTEIGEWTSKSSPSGTATVVIKMVEQGQPWSAGTTILTINHSGTDDGDDTFAAIPVPAHAHLFALLTAVSGCRVLTVNLRERRR